jgi:serine/threonine protein kinase/Tol biopolymer transport system component
MSVTIGARIGPYQIVGTIGAGGMGEVYRARDAKLDRDVAIKVLPEAFATDPDRLARFEREAKTLAALNHPNIAHIHGLEDSGGIRALVMELVEGEDLAERLARGRIPVEDALPIARQIAAALEAAHDQGIVHRDLKPANIRVTADGSVKVLDFGLAKAFAGEAVSAGAVPADIANSPTMASPALTQIGLVVGTAPYMSPEQAKGRPVDRRADIWAFGAVLYEMLVGRRAFGGDDISDVLASVLKTDPAWTALPDDVPASVRRLLRRCLEKDPRKRLSAIGDARLDLDDIEELPAALTAPRAQRARVPWLAIGSAAVAGALLASSVMFVALRPRAAAATARLSIVPPTNTDLFPDSSQSALSPDGRAVAFITGANAALDKSELWIRRLDVPAARRIDGVAGAQMPFWSPDGARVAFFAEGKLKTVALDGGRVDVVADASDGRGGTWALNGTIVFAPTNAGPLMKVSSTGGRPVPVTTLDAQKKETGHRFPFFLPDGQHFLFAALPAHAADYDIFIGAVDSTERSLLLSAESAPVYSEPGYLFFVRKDSIIAQPFDASRLRLTGAATVLDDVPGAVGNQYSAAPGVSATAHSLVYLNDPFAETRLSWVDREGRETGVVDAPPARYAEIRVSPDGNRAAVARSTSARASAVWVLDLVRHGATRIASAAGLNYQIAWSPDGKRLAYASDASGSEKIFVRDAAAATPEVQLFDTPDLFNKPSSWSPDGSLLLFGRRVPGTQNDLAYVATSGGTQAKPYLNDVPNEDLGKFSPDGKWIAYISDEAGSNDVYIRSFPVPDHKYRVTTDGGTAVWWGTGGTSLLIAGADGHQLKIAAVRLGAELVVESPRPAGTVPRGALAFDPSPDLQRFLVAIPAGGNSGLSLMVVNDWLAAIR